MSRQHLRSAVAALFVVAAAASAPASTPALSLLRGAVLPLAAAAPARVTRGVSERWEAAPIPLAVASTVTALDEGAFDAVTTAAAVWQLVGAQNPAIEMHRADVVARRDGVNSVSRGPIEVPGHEHDVAITISYADECTGVIVEADIVLNERYDFAVVDAPGGELQGETLDTARCRETYDLQSVLTHELGHLYGLDEDTESPSSTMGPKTNPCSTAKRYLSNDDRVAMRRLYSQDPAAPSCAVGAVGRPSAGVAIAAVVVAALARLSGGLRRARWSRR